MRTISTLIFLLIALDLAACDSGSRGPPPNPAALKPTDAHLASLYEQSCKLCHANPASGAPVVHDHNAWDPRWAKGMDVLTAHAVGGFGAMPAGGQCASCTLADYQRLIRFMADRENDK